MTEFNHDSLFDKLKSDIEAICNASVDEYKKSVASKLGSDDYTPNYGMVTDKSLGIVSNHCYKLFEGCQKVIEDNGHYMIHFFHFNWPSTQSELGYLFHDLCFAIDNYGDYVVGTANKHETHQMFFPHISELNTYSKQNLKDLNHSTPIKKEKGKYPLPNILIDAIKNMHFDLTDVTAPARDALGLTVSVFLTEICKIAKHYHMRFVRFEKLFKSDDFEKYDDVVSILDGTTKELNEMQKRVIDLEFALSDMKKLLLEKDNEIARGCDKLKTIKDSYMKLIDSLEDV